MIFELDPRLAADTVTIGDLSLSRALLMNDARYPWIILTPRRPGAVEITDLSPPDRLTLMEEIAAVCESVRALPNVAKINVGALGNIVSQLHVHIIGRSDRDFAWPRPVWGLGAPRLYEEEQRAALLARLKSELV